MYLTRNKQVNCVMARVMRQGVRYQANFSLKRYRSWSRAEKAAKRWLKRVLPKLPPKSEASSKDRLTRRNHSGVVGVYRTPGAVRRRKGRIRYFPRWVARWPGCKLRGGLSWSVQQFEEQGAFVLAVLSRKRETVSRKTIIAAYEGIKGTKQYRKILKAGVNRRRSGRRH